jgi:phenylacetate-CoA ligase
MTNNDLMKYYQLINEFEPDYIYGLPSAITVLAYFLVERGLRICSLKGLLCGSENMSQQQRKFLTDSFSARVFTWYGQTEKVVLGAECEYSMDYHLFPEYGYTELVDDDGRVIHEPGRIGEIVGTVSSILQCPDSVQGGILASM